MEISDALKMLSKKLNTSTNIPETEEATKNAYVMPFIAALGYNVFDISEVVPEMTCDVATKKGEKIDYAIMVDLKPSIIIECKQFSENLDKHISQLVRYYNTSEEIKFGILTNGQEYRFYSDLVSSHIMDLKPFLVINMKSLSENDIAQLNKFHKSKFNIDEIAGSASSLKYSRELKEIIATEFAHPSEQLVRFFCKEKNVYSGKITSAIIEQFTPIVKKSIADYIQDIITLRLNAAINNENTSEDSIEETNKVSSEDPKENSKINTTEEELEAFHIIKSILRQTVDSSRITYRDAQSYFGIFLDNNRLKTICRIYVESKISKKLCIIDDQKHQISYPLETVDDIYKYSDELIASVSRFIED